MTGGDALRHSAAGNKIRIAACKSFVHCLHFVFFFFFHIQVGPTGSQALVIYLLEHAKLTQEYAHLGPSTIKHCSDLNLHSKLRSKYVQK
jgi:hypothetical protein